MCTCIGRTQKLLKSRKMRNWVSAQHYTVSYDNWMCVCVCSFVCTCAPVLWGSVLCVCVCVRETERERESVVPQCMCMCLLVYLHIICVGSRCFVIDPFYLCEVWDCFYWCVSTSIPSKDSSLRYSLYPPPPIRNAILLTILCTYMCIGQHILPIVMSA